jgi:hypothetical protein
VPCEQERIARLRPATGGGALGQAWLLQLFAQCGEGAAPRAATLRAHWDEALLYRRLAAFYRLEELLHATTYLTLLAVSNDLVMVLLSSAT